MNVGMDELAHPASTAHPTEWPSQWHATTAPQCVPGPAAHTYAETPATSPTAPNVHEAPGHQHATAKPKPPSE